MLLQEEKMGRSWRQKYVIGLEVGGLASSCLWHHAHGVLILTVCLNCGTELAALIFVLVTALPSPPLSGAGCTRTCWRSLKRWSSTGRWSWEDLEFSMSRWEQWQCSSTPSSLKQFRHVSLTISITRLFIIGICWMTEPFQIQVSHHTTPQSFSRSSDLWRRTLLLMWLGLL